MAVIQALRFGTCTFRDFALSVLQAVVSTHPRGQTSRYDFVIDQYFTVSIKEAERTKRASCGVLNYGKVKPSQRCPKQWKKFLSSGENKTALIQFLADEWGSDYYAGELNGVLVYVCCGSECHVLTSDGHHVKSATVNELSCNHEEADTRLFFHARHAAISGAQTVIVRSPDTDAAVIGVHVAALEPFKDVNLLLLTGRKDGQRYVNLSGISRKLGRDITDALSGYHSFTGCDSTSAFIGKGKQSSFRLLLQNRTMQSSMGQLGVSLNCSHSCHATCEAYICSLYGQHSCTSVNEARYKIFCAKTPEAHKLPPTADALRYHVKRANYQVYVWRSSLQPMFGFPSPDGHGWIVSTDPPSITINWMAQLPAPRAVLEILSCNCKTGCTTSRCGCIKNSLKCTDVCGCKDCANKEETHDVDESLAGEDDVEDEDSGDDESDFEI